MKKIIVIVLVSFAGFYAVKDYFIPSTWNYRITVEIETPEGVKSGSAVRQVRAWKNIAKWLNPDVRSISYDVIGEAVVIDLGERGHLLQLPGYEIFFKAFGYYTYKVKGIYKLKEERVIKGDYKFISFADINDPMSIRTVDSKMFPKLFGDGVSFKQIKIEITNDPVTWGQIRKHLTWYGVKAMGLRRWDPQQPDKAKYFRENDLIKGKK